jgi:hypothetical protein
MFLAMPKSAGYHILAAFCLGNAQKLPLRAYTPVGCKFNYLKNLCRASTHFTVIYYFHVLVLLARLKHGLYMPHSLNYISKPYLISHNKALGLDGFLVEFFQAFWSLIKDDLLVMFREFHVGSLPLFNLNFGTITLIPKQKERSSKSNSTGLFVCLM